MKPILILLLAGSASLPAQTATIQMQKAIVSTEEGMRAAAHLKGEWGPEEAALEKREAELKANQQKLETDSRKSHGRRLWHHTMSSKERARRQKEIDTRAGILARDRERDRAQIAQEQTRIVNDIAKRMNRLLDGFATEHGYALIMDTGNPQSTVLVTTTDVTDEIVSLFDRTYPPGTIAPGAQSNPAR